MSKCHKSYVDETCTFYDVSVEQFAEESGTDESANPILCADKTCLSRKTTRFQRASLWLPPAYCEICPASVGEWVRTQMSHTEIESRRPRLTAGVLGSHQRCLRRPAWTALEAHTGEQQHTVYLRSNLHLWNHPLSHNRLQTEPISEQECNLKVGDATLLKALREFIFFVFQFL